MGGIVLILCFIGGPYLADSLMGQGYTRSHEWVFSIFIVFAALIIWLIGMSLDKFPAREWVDPKTQKTVLIKEKHMIFFIPLKYFAVLLVVWAVFLALRSLSA